MAAEVEVEVQRMMALVEVVEEVARHQWVVEEPPWYWAAVEVERCYDREGEVEAVG